MSDRSETTKDCGHQLLVSLCRAHGLALSADQVPDDPDELFDRLAQTGVSSAEGRRLQLARALGAAAAQRVRSSTAEDEVARLESSLRDAMSECERLRERTDGVLAALDAATDEPVCAVTGLSREALRDDALAPLLERLAVLTHKINNPLTSLLGRTQILQLQRRDDPTLSKALCVIGESGQRIAELVRELARMARSGKLDASRLVDPDR